MFLEQKHERCTKMNPTIKLHVGTKRSIVSYTVMVPTYPNVCVCVCVLDWIRIFRTSGTTSKVLLCVPMHVVLLQGLHMNECP